MLLLWFSFFFFFACTSFERTFSPFLPLVVCVCVYVCGFVWVSCVFVFVSACHTHLVSEYLV
jgi:hypothetical protein